MSRASIQKIIHVPLVFPVEDANIVSEHSALAHLIKDGMVDSLYNTSILVNSHAFE